MPPSQPADSDPAFDRTNDNPSELPDAQGVWEALQYDSGLIEGRSELDIDALAMSYRLKRTGGEELFTILLGRVVHQARQWTGLGMEADDFGQAVALKVLEHFDQWDGTRSFASWVWRIARNAYNDRLRELRAQCRDRTREQSSDELADFDPAARELCPPEELIRGERNGEVANCLNDMSEAMAHALWLKYVEELHHVEIGVVMNRTETAVSKLVARGRVRMKELLVE